MLSAKLLILRLSAIKYIKIIFQTLNHINIKGVSFTYPFFYTPSFGNAITEIPEELICVIKIFLTMSRDEPRLNLYLQMLNLDKEKTNNFQYQNIISLQVILLMYHSEVKGFRKKYKKISWKLG